MHNTFYRKKADASKLLANLNKKLDQVDKNLKKLADTIPSTAGAATPVPPAAAATPAAPAESENSKGLGALLDRLPFGSRKKSASRESLATPSPAATTTAAAASAVAEKPVEGTGQETPKKTTEEQDEEGSDEEDDDDEDVVSDKKKGKAKMSYAIALC